MCCILLLHVKDSGMVDVRLNGLSPHGHDGIAAGSWLGLVTAFSATPRLLVDDDTTATGKPAVGVK